jgi:hypothetical protein
MWVTPDNTEPQVLRITWESRWYVGSVQVLQSYNFRRPHWYVWMRHSFLRCVFQQVLWVAFPSLSR